MLMMLCSRLSFVPAPHPLQGLLLLAASAAAAAAAIRYILGPMCDHCVFAGFHLEFGSPETTSPSESCLFVSAYHHSFPPMSCFFPFVIVYLLPPAHPLYPISVSLSRCVCLFVCVCLSVSVSLFSFPPYLLYMLLCLSSSVHRLPFFFMRIFDYPFFVLSSYFFYLLLSFLCCFLLSFFFFFLEGLREEAAAACTGRARASSASPKTRMATPTGVHRVQ